MSCFTALYKKGRLQLIQIFLWICHFSNLFRKTNFPSFSELLSERVNFLTKRRTFPWISQKTLQNNRKAYFSCIWLILRRKTFFVNLVLVQFYWFDLKHLFKQIQIFLRICPFSNLLRKKKFLSIFVLLSEIVIFLTKMRIFQWISPKMLKNHRKSEFSCMWFNLGRKTVF